MAYEINYDDDRFKQVEAERKEALTEVENLYGGMAKDSEKFYQAQIDASKEWGDKQQELQQEKTDFAIEQIEQQKEQAKKDYIKEQSGAYQDWQKQSNKYGANAEAMASNGMQNSGYSETSEVLMHNQYQSRVATARESYGRAVLNYDNAIKDARLQNNSILAEIAYNALQQQLELSLQGFQYKNELIDKKVTQQNNINNRYDNKWQSVLDQMNKENSLAESVRQYNQDYALQLQKLQEEQRQFNITNSNGVNDGVIGGGSSTPDLARFGGVNKSTDRNMVDTAYFKGEKNPDCKTYGTFGNGYQPKGIGDAGKVNSIGELVQIETTTLSGQKQTLSQDVWQTEDGRLWYWSDRDNQYKPLD